MEVTAAVTIQAPIDRVFGVFTDFRKMEERLSGVQKIEFLEKGGEPVVGMKWRETRIMFGKEATEVMWISDLQPNKSYVVEAESHGTHYTSTYTFKDVGGATEVTLTFGGEPLTFGSRVLAVAFSFMKGSIKKSLQADMEELKKVVEGS